jgi:hypothetical protein
MYATGLKCCFLVHDTKQFRRWFANVSEKPVLSEVSALLTQKSTTLQANAYALGTPSVYNPVLQSSLSRPVYRIAYLKPVAYHFLGRGDQLSILCVGLVL